MIISLWLLHRMRNIWDKSCKENQNTHFIFSNFFFVIKHAIYERMWERHNMDCCIFTATVVMYTCHIACSLPILLNISIFYRPYPPPSPLFTTIKSQAIYANHLLLWSIIQQYEIRYKVCVSVCVCVCIEDTQDVLPKEMVSVSILQTLVSFHSIKSCIYKGWCLTEIMHMKQ